MKDQIHGPVYLEQPHSCQDRHRVPLELGALALLAGQRRPACAPCWDYPPLLAEENLDDEAAGHCDDEHWQQVASKDEQIFLKAVEKWAVFPMALEEVRGTAADALSKVSHMAIQIHDESGSAQ